MSDLITETQDALKQERLYQIWQKHGNLILGAVLALIIGTAAFSAYNAWDSASKTAATERMLTVFDDPATSTEIQSLSGLDLPGGLKGLAGLKLAGQHLQEKNIPAATTLYEEITNSKDIPQDLRDLAALTLARIAASAETPDLKKAQTLLEPIAQNKNAAFNALATLELAVIHAAGNDLDKAISMLETLKNTPGLPETIYLKTQSLSHIYKLRAQDKQKS